MPLKITYPTIHIKGSPTPYDTLFVCDFCKAAVWGFVSSQPMRHYVCKDGKARVMRLATDKEKEEARAAIKLEIP